jgi:hypothetical protein
MPVLEKEGNKMMRFSALNFSETQRFRQTWLWILFALLSGGFLFIVAAQTIGVGILNNLFPSSALALMGSLIFFIILLLYKSSLSVKINRGGIYYRFTPFHWYYRKIDWKDIEKVYVRRYDALTEYGSGWGIKFGNAGKAYTVSGHYGLQIDFLDERKILLGTQRPDDLEKILSKAI